MKPRFTFAKDHLHQIYPDPVPWVGEVFDPRIETLLESPDIDNKDRLMIRLRAGQSRTAGDARHLLKYLKRVLPELFNKGADGGNCKGGKPMKGFNEFFRICRFNVLTVTQDLSPACRWCRW